MKVKRGKSKLLKIILIILIVLIVLVGGFFGFKGYSKWRYNKDVKIFDQGFTYGYTNAIIQIINVSYACQPFPVYVGNQTTTLISVDCLSNG
jgi:flagellar basal body-associated protein FliL